MPEITEAKKSHGLFIGVGQREADSEAMQISAGDASYTRQAFATYGKLNNPEEPVLNEKANKKNIIQKLDNIIEQTNDTPADFVVIYFSGHGCELNGNYYLICHNTTNTNLEETAINGIDFLSFRRYCKRRSNQYSFCRKFI